VHAHVRACTRAFRAGPRVQVSFNERSVSNGSGARRSSEWGLQTSGRAGGSLTLRFYFLRSFPPAPRATPLFLDTRDTVVRRPCTSRERTPTLERADYKNRFSLPRPTPRFPVSFHEIRSAPFFLSRQMKRTVDDRRDGFLTFCLRRRDLQIRSVLSFCYSSCLQSLHTRRCKINFSPNKRYVI